MNDFEKKIKDYLDKRAAEDELFAKTYAKKNKSFEECIQYIFGEAFKKAVRMPGVSGKGSVFEDEVVYGLAVHYYDEDDIKVSKVQGQAVASTSGKATATKPAADYKPTKKDREAARVAALKRLEEEAYNKLRTPRKKQHVEQNTNQMALFEI